MYAFVDVCDSPEALSVGAAHTHNYFLFLHAYHIFSPQIAYTLHIFAQHSSSC